MDTTLPARPKGDAAASAFAADTGDLAAFFRLALTDPASAARRLAA